MIHGHLCVLQNRSCYAISITARPMRQNSDAWILSYDTVAADCAPAGSAAGVDKLIASEKQSPGVYTHKTYLEDVPDPPEPPDVDPPPFLTVLETQGT